MHKSRKKIDNKRNYYNGTGVTVLFIKCVFVCVWVNHWMRHSIHSRFNFTISKWKPFTEFAMYTISNRVNAFLTRLLCSSYHRLRIDTSDSLSYSMIGWFCFKCVFFFNVRQKLILISITCYTMRLSYIDCSLIYSVHKFCGNLYM